MRFALTFFALIASSFASTTPTAVRLAFVPDGMSVSWSTDSEVNSPTVIYGSSPTALNNLVSGSSSSYGTQFFHTSVINGLLPNTLYYYQVLAGDSGSTSSPVRTFTTAQSAGDASEFNLIVVGDMGLHNSDDVMKTMINSVNTTDFVLHIGDVSYADDWYLRPFDSDSNTYEKSWHTWQQKMEPVTSQLAYMVEPGNHEATCTEVTPSLCAAHEKNFTAFNTRFRMPSLESGGVMNMWYSFDFGLAHFVQISTETDFPNAAEGPNKHLASGPFGDQLSWLRADLEAANNNRVNTPWIIVSGHRPFYSSRGNCPECIAAFEEMFLKYGVDIYLSGHKHYYERLWPIGANGVVTQKDYFEPSGIVHLINGAGGNVEGHESAPRNPEPFTAMYNNKDYGWNRLTVLNATDIAWEFYAATGFKVVDSISIHKSH